VSGWVWLDRAVLVAAHDEQLAEHGGAAGFRDEGLLDSALARPLNLAAYESPDVAALAASYAVALAKNDPFVDGNKRAAFVAMELFLWLNGHELNAGDAECVLAMLNVAAGEWDEATLAAWLRERITPRT
jgi:death-on-curing protein